MLIATEITSLHIEPSSICNARCPLCPRNLWGYPHNCGYVETSLSLALVEKSLSPSFLQQIDNVLFNGNFGDFTANLEIVDIIRYLKSCNTKMSILVSTNGSARSRDFWQELGTIPDLTIEFCLDGLADTHHLYRQDTSWHKIIDNAKTFIAAGGKATWKMIKFDHNLHQQEACEQMSKELGFKRFLVTDYGRDVGPSFNRDGTLSHTLGEYEGFRNANEALSWLESDPSYNFPSANSFESVDCKAKNRRQIYLSAEGKVYPCCWLGFSPETYHKTWTGKLNQQIAPLVSKNDLNHHTLEECLEWFIEVEKSWEIPLYQKGRLAQCDIVCGKRKNCNA